MSADETRPDPPAVDDPVESGAGQYTGPDGARFGGSDVEGTGGSSRGSASTYSGPDGEGDLGPHGP